MSVRSTELIRVFAGDMPIFEKVGAKASLKKATRPGRLRQFLSSVGFLAAGRPLDLGCDVGDEIGVRAAEAVDGLLGVADPDARLGDPRHGDEDRELQGAGVLEFVDEDGFDALAQLEFEIGVAEKFQREAVLIDEVDEPPIPLVFLIGAHGLGGAGEHRGDVLSDLIEQARMTGEGRRRFPQRSEVRFLGLGALDLGELCPALPRHVLDPAARRDVADLVQGPGSGDENPLVRRILGEERPQCLAQSGIEALPRLTGKRRRNQLLEAGDGAFRAGRKRCPRRCCWRA